MENNQEKVIWQGRFVDMVMRDRWEYIRRKNLSGIVGIVALTESNEIVLIKQYRPPLDCEVIEIPAGIVGDVPDWNCPHKLAHHP